jgi:hypothetical protein
MKKLIILSISAMFFLSFADPDANTILVRVDKNMSSKNRIIESEIIIHGLRTSRILTSITYSVGYKQSFTEYLFPARGQGTKILKLENK